MHLGNDNKNSAKTQGLIICKQKRRKETRGALVSPKTLVNHCVILLGKKANELLVLYDVFEENRKKH